MRGDVEVEDVDIVVGERDEKIEVWEEGWEDRGKC